MLIFASTSALADYNFNFDGVASGTSANNALVNPYSDVQFLSAFLTADLDAQGFEIVDINTNQLIPGFTHFEAYANSDIRVRDPQFYNHGVAPSGVNAIDAKFDELYIKFATEQNLTSFSAQLDNSQYGIYNANFIFVNAAGKTIDSITFNSYDNPGAIITKDFTRGVGGIILSKGKLYDNITIATVAAVPEPQSYALILMGLSLFGLLSKKSKNK